MDESLDPVDRLPDTQHSDRVNPADRSNPEKKDNGFSNALKEKMKEKLKRKAQKEDQVVLESAPETSDEDQSDEQQSEHLADEPENDGTETSEDDTTPEHIDLKA